MEKKFSVTFEGLNVEMQRSIIASADEEEILWQGVISKDLKTRLITLKNPNTTSEMLEKMLEQAGEEDDDLVEAILQDSRLIQTKELITKLRKSPDFILREKAAEQIQDGSILDEMMKYELKTGKNHYVIVAIFSNKSYVYNKQDIIEAYKQLYSDDEREKLIEFIEDDEILNELLKTDINYRQLDVNAISLILNHNMWIPKREMVHDLVKRASGITREEIAEKLSRPDVINMMLAEEVIGDNNSDVLMFLIDNPKCQLTSTEEKLLIEKAEWSIREKMAKESKDLNFLNELLLWEIENAEDIDVIVAVLENETFTLTKDWQERLYKICNYSKREWLAKNADDASLLLRWYLEEDDTEIADLILANKHFPEEAKAPLKISIFKKREIISILRKAGVKNRFKVLDELLEVINK